MWCISYAELTGKWFNLKKNLTLLNAGYCAWKFSFFATLKDACTFTTEAHFMFEFQSKSNNLSRHSPSTAFLRVIIQNVSRKIFCFLNASTAFHILWYFHTSSNRAVCLMVLQYDAWKLITLLPLVQWTMDVFEPSFISSSQMKQNILFFQG